jgi:hypothetical protein
MQLCFVGCVFLGATIQLCDLLDCHEHLRGFDCKNVLNVSIRWEIKTIACQ